jgi:hypothetical protein
MQSIRDFVMAQPLFDGHEHLQTIPAIATQRWTPLSFAGYAAADLLVAAGPARAMPPRSGMAAGSATLPLRSGMAAGSATLPPRSGMAAGSATLPPRSGMAAGSATLPPDDSPEFAALFFSNWEKARNTGYCRAVESAIRSHFNLEFNLETWPTILELVQAEVAPDPAAWYRGMLGNQAGIAWIVTDAIKLPAEAAPGLFPDNVRFNYRDDELLALNGRHIISQREQRWQRSIHSLGDLLVGLMQSISDCLATGLVTGFKIGQAYYGDLSFHNTSRSAAERAFDRLMQVAPGALHDRPVGQPVQSRVAYDQLRPLRDYLVHQYIRRASDEGLVIQIHTGYLAGNWNALENVNPMQLCPVLRQYPGSRFDLFHAGWPYQEEMAAIGKHHPNVWVNLCWAWAMNPASTERALDSFLDTIPHNKIIAFGGDTTNPFCSYAYAMQAREGLARVLAARIVRGDMDSNLAHVVAGRIMLDNGMELHGL